MADEEVTNILNTLGLSHLTDTFKQNKITFNVFKLLTASLISDLIPNIGDRAIFLNYYTNLNDNGSDTNKEVVNKDNKENKLLDDLDDQVVENIKPLNILLNETESGRRILAIYKKNQKLEDTHRKKLCSLIIGDLENRRISLTNSMSQKISESLIKQFPSEASDTYYIPPVLKKNSRTGKSIPARGKLPSMWKNNKYMNKQLIKKTEKVLADTEIKTIKNPDDLSELIKDTISWLQNNQAPWNIVIEKWKETSIYRMLNFYRSTDFNLIDIFHTWPLYKHPFGFQLIDLDFKSLNLSEVTLDINIWNLFFETLKENSGVKAKDETAQTFLDQLSSEKLTNDSKVLMSIYLMAHLYPPREMRKVNEKLKKPSIGLAKDSLIKIISGAGDITKVRDEVKARCLALKVPSQPYLIVIGSMENIEKIFVSIDEVLYEIPSVLEGLDICFKAFHVFNLQYPFSSEHLWILIQKGLYKLHLKNDSKIISIQHVLKIFDPQPKSISIDDIIRNLNSYGGAAAPLDKSIRADIDPSEENYPLDGSNATDSNEDTD